MCVCLLAYHFMVNILWNFQEMKDVYTEQSSVLEHSSGLLREAVSKVTVTSAPCCDPRALGRGHQDFLLLLLDDVGVSVLCTSRRSYFTSFISGFFGRACASRGSTAPGLPAYPWISVFLFAEQGAARPARGWLGGGTHPRSASLGRDGREEAHRDQELGGCAQRKAVACSSLAPAPRLAALCSRLGPGPEVLMTHTFL